MFKISTSDLSVSLKAGVSTKTIFDFGNFETDTLKPDMVVVRGSEPCLNLMPAAISTNFSGASSHYPSQHRDKDEKRTVVFPDPGGPIKLEVKLDCNLYMSLT